NGLYYPIPVSTFIGQGIKLRRQPGMIGCSIFWHRECCAFTSVLIESLKLLSRDNRFPPVLHNPSEELPSCEVSR
ncbi:hypothetical protein, partial [Pseudomonas sp. BF-RE-21]|uniref:hypothetical protein n=1 Tax=Pseudomonas sp. BF-RE-21 TaxID=2832383 RepID=UPI001CBB0F9F